MALAAKLQRCTPSIARSVLRVVAGAGARTRLSPVLRHCAVRSVATTACRLAESSSSVGTDSEDGFDPYAWLEDPRDEDVRALIDRENEMATEALAETTKLQEALVKEMKDRMAAQSEDQLPDQYHGYEYFERTPVDQEHSMLCRRPLVEKSAEPEVLLDVNKLAAGTGYAEVELALYSHDGRAMVYMVDTTGTEHLDLYIKNLRSGQSHKISSNADGAVFVDPANPQGLLYLTRDSKTKTVTMWHCALDADLLPGTSHKLWSLRDAACDVTLEPVGDGGWAKLQCEWAQRSQLYLVDATPLSDDPEGHETGAKSSKKPANRPSWQKLSRYRPTLVHPDEPNSHFDVEEHGGWMYVTSTKPPHNIWRFKPSSPERRHWQMVLDESAGVEIIRASMTEKYCLVGVKKRDAFVMEVYPWEWLLPRIDSDDHATACVGTADEISQRPWEVDGQALRPDDGLPYAMSLFDPSVDVTSVDPRTMSPEANSVRVHVNHPTAREAVFQVDLDTATGTRLTREPKWKKFPYSLFETQYDAYKMTAFAEDRTAIPITVVHKQGIKLNRSNPCVVMTYGSYGVDLDTSFDAPLMSLIRRGWVVAYTHTRGGGEKGDAWHAAGRAENKLNTFKDFVACSKHLADCGLTRPEIMAAYAGSAGATALAYVANEEPNLYKAMVLESPFLDVEHSLTNPEYEFAIEDRVEWGDPTNPKVRDIIRSYDPVRNVGEHGYPWMLCIASRQDSRVPYWHAAKYVASIIDNRTAENPLLLQIREGAHIGGSHRSFAVDQSAFVFSFLMMALEQPLK